VVVPIASLHKTHQRSIADFRQNGRGFDDGDHYREDVRQPSPLSTQLLINALVGLGPAIHVFLVADNSWMPGTRPGKAIFLRFER